MDDFLEEANVYNESTNETFDMEEEEEISQVDF